MTSSSAGSASSDERVGNMLSDRYLIEEVLGRGGMSTVYRASDAALGRTVALKVFRADLADADDLRRQQSEIQLLASLNHSTLVTLYDAITDEADRVALVLEYVDGRDLRDELDAGRIDERTTAMIGADIADALAYVHARGIVHRDLKPGNLLIPAQTAGSTGPRAKLTDFGIARIIDGTHMTAAGAVIGTVGYLSPEQALGTPIGPASDVYSLGLVLLECLTGTRAFGGTGVEAIAARLSRDPEIPASLGRPWIVALGRMTRRTPEERATAAEASELLREIALSLPSGAGEGAPTMSFTPLAPVDPSAQYSPEPLDATKKFAAGDSDPTAAQATGASAGGSEDAPFAGSNDVTARYASIATPAARAAPSATAAPAAPAASAHGAPQTTPARASGQRPNRRRLITVVMAIAALVIVGAAIGALVVQGQADEPAQATIEYPAVDGELGSHLEQLQGSVTP